MTKQFLKILFILLITLPALVATSDSPSSSSSSGVSLMGDVTDAESHRQKRKLDNPSQPQPEIAPVSGCFNAVRQPSEFPNCPRRLESAQFRAASLAEIQYPAKLEADDLDAEGQMFIGKKWVAWVTRLFNQPINKVINNNGTQLTIQEPRCPEEIINKLALACARCPNVVTTLRDIRNSYFTDVPQELHIFKKDEQQRVVIIEDKIKGQELIQLLSGLAAVQPYVLADSLLHALTSERIFVGAPIIFHSLAGDSLCVCAGMWFKHRLIRSLDLVQRLYRSCTKQLPYIYQNLKEQSSAEAAEARRMIEKTIILPFGQIATVAHDMQNEQIWRHQQALQQLRSCQAGEIMRGHSIPRDQLANAVNTADKQLCQNLEEFKKKALDDTQQAANNNEKGSLYIRAAALTKALLENGYAAPLAACREIAHYYSRAVPGKPFSDEQLKEAAGFASRAVTLAGNACSRQDLNTAATLYAMLCNRILNLSYLQKAALFNNRLVAEFPSLVGIKEFHNAAFAFMILATKQIKGGQMEDFVAACRSAVRYFDKAISLVPQGTEQEIATLLQSTERIPRGTRGIALEYKNNELQAVAARAESYLNALKCKTNPIDQPD